MGRAARRRPGQAAPTPSRTGRRSASPRWPTSGSPCTACRWSPTASSPSGRRPRTLARELFVRHALVLGEWRAAAPVLRDQPAPARGGGASSSTAPGGATSWSTRRRCSTSTTRGSRPTWSPVRTSTPGGSRSVAPAPSCSPSTPRCWCTRARAWTSGDFPDEWHEGPTVACRCSYHFEPGHEADGVTIDVPLATLNTVGAAPFTWNVPGLRQELVTALIRSLPKPLRVNFVPAPDVARRFLEAVPPGEEALVEALSRYLRSLSGVHVPEEAWDLAKVPEHLRPTFRVVDDDGSRGRRRQGPGGAQAAAAALLRPGDAAGGRRVRGDRDRSDHVDVRHHRAVVHPDAGRARGPRVPRPWSTRAPPSGCGSPRPPTSRRPTTGSAYDGCCCSRSPHPPPRSSTASTTPPSWGWPRRRTRTCGRSSTTASTAAAGELVDQTGPVRDPEAFAALVTLARASCRPRRRRCSSRCCACSPSGGRSTRRCTGASRCRCCRR